MIYDASNNKIISKVYSELSAQPFSAIIWGVNGAQSSPTT